MVSYSARESSSGGSRNNNRGFGLVEFLVATGLLVVLVLGFGSYIRNSLKSQFFTKMQGQVDNFHEEVRALLSSGEACKLSFQGTPLRANTVAPALELKSKDGTKAYGIGSIDGDHSFEIKKWSFRVT
jgi:hypothetical protein